MKSRIVLEVETKEMTKDIIPEETGGVANVTEEDCADEIEDSIHSTIPLLITDERVLKLIYEIINEGGWIDEIEDAVFPDAYCKKFSIKVISER